MFNTLKKFENLLSLNTNEAHANSNKVTANITELTNKNDRIYVIQKYIERPLLINKRKFDIRVWVLVTHELKVFFFREGYLRTSSEIFSLDEDTIDDKDVHLTNNAIQKFGAHYGQFEDGNQLSFNQFQVHTYNM